MPEDNSELHREGGDSGRHQPADDSTVSIVDELKSAYLDYAMSVIVSRAIPDLRDGLKPVHRRILFAMHDSGNTHDKPYRKSARPVGEVMGKYHPHGDAAIYDSLVRMAQHFSMSLPLLDGQGNFGSMDGDNPAAMRYTEVRMDRAAGMLLEDIDRDTVDFQDNYDGKDREPSVLPARFPNLLVNGGSGIAVGMATNIPPHNLGEVIDGTLAMIEDPDISVERLMELIPGPDFPTGGVIHGRAGARKAYVTGRGGVVVRAKTRFEEIRKDRQAIIVDEIPYQVNKALMIERIAQIAKEGKIEGISSIRDESDRVGVRVVIELKRDATAEIVLNQLWRFTPMESSFSCNLLALNGGRPELLTLWKVLRSFLDFREEVVTRRTAEELRRARARSHVLCGLAVAVSNLDEVVAIIRSSPEPAVARSRLQERDWPAAEIAEFVRLVAEAGHMVDEDGTYRLSEIQARAILDLRLQRLTALGVREITDELQTLASRIRDFLDILASGHRIRQIIAGELEQAREKFAVPRRSSIEERVDDIEDEDLIEPEEMVITITNGGYIKRTPLSEYRAQKRGGKGLSGMATRDEDFVITQHVANTHTALLFFSTDGMVYKLKTWRLPKAGRNARGKAIVNILPIERGVSIAAITPIYVDEADWEDYQIAFATSGGRIRRNQLSDFANVRANGKIAMRLPPDETLVSVSICGQDDDILLANASGNVIRFSVDRVRIRKSRYSTGIKGMKVKSGDRVVSMVIARKFEATPEVRDAYFKTGRELHREQDTDEEVRDSTGLLVLSDGIIQAMRESERLLLSISSDGTGKIMSSHHFTAKGRGGKGIIAKAGGGVVGFDVVELDDQIMLTTNSGQTIRCSASDIRVQSRASRGVRVINLSEGEEVVSVARIVDTGEDDTAGQADGQPAEPDPAPSAPEG